MSLDADLRALERRAALGEPGAEERLALAEAHAGRSDPPMRWPVVVSGTGTRHLWVGEGRAPQRGCATVTVRLGGSSVRVPRMPTVPVHRTACGVAAIYEPGAAPPRRRGEIAWAPHTSDFPPDCRRCCATIAHAYVKCRGRLPRRPWWRDPETTLRELEARVPEPLRMWVARHLRAYAEVQEVMFEESTP